MKLIVECAGDVSESVSSYEMSVDFGDIEICDEERTDIRNLFIAAFENGGFIYSSASFRFEDECSECYTRLENDDCPRCREYYDSVQKRAMLMHPLYDWIEYNDKKLTGCHTGTERTKFNEDGETCD